MLRRLLIAVPTALLFALLTAAAVAAHDGHAAHDQLAAAGQQELRGRVVETHGDTLGGAPTGRTFWLETANGERVKLDAGRRRLTPGDTVKVRGSRTASTFLVAEGQGGLTTVEPMSFSAIGAATTKTVAVIAFTFSDNTAQPWTTTQMGERFFGASNSVNAYFGEASYGQVAVTGDVFGWFSIAATDDACQATSTWKTQARAAATAAGVNLAAYNHVAYIFPKASACSWAGLAYMPGTESWNNGTLSTRVAGHELAHNFGVHHAASLTCTSGGVRVTLSATCSETEYGDPFDIMGSSSRLTNNWHRWRLKYFTDSEVTTVTSANAGRFTVGVVSRAGSVPKIVRVARGNDRFYYLEFRQPFGGFDNFATTDPVVNGVLIRIAANTTNMRPQLLDANPSTSSFADAGFGAGRTFTDEANGISISVVSVSTSGAVVDVSFGADTAAPSAPGSLTASATQSSVTLSWAAATDNMGTVGYLVRRDGLQVADQAGRTFTDAGLAAGRSYAYEVVAYDAAGNVGPAASRVATTTAPVPPESDTTAPTAPGGLTATAKGPTSIVLAWTAATDNVGVAGYQITRNGVVIRNQADLTFTSSGLLPATTYTYTVAAVDAAGNVGPAVSATATTKVDKTPPGKAKSLRIAPIGDRTVKLTWQAAYDNVKVRGYRIYRDGRYLKTVTGLRTYVRATRGYHTFKVKAIDTSRNIGLAVGWSVRVR